MKARLKQSKFAFLIRLTAAGRPCANFHVAALRSVLALLFLLLAGCFEYEESVTFNGDFSGLIEFRYTVPVHEQTGRSLIAFLPSTPSDIRARYAVRSLHPEILDFQLEPLPGDPFPQAKVSYRVRFKQAKELEAYLPGEVQVFQGGNTLRLYRSLPGLDSGQEGRQMRVYRIAYRSISEKLKGRSMKFSIQCPWYYDILSNQGSLPSPGVVYFQFPLERTVLQKKETLWNVEIKANPSPEVEKKKLQAPAGRPH